MLKRFLQGRFMNHPLHPLLVHLPVGLWVASLVFDIAHFANGSPNLAAASYYCMLLGLIGAALAIAPGLSDFLEIPANTTAKKLGSLHLVMNVTIIAIFVIDFIGRASLEGGAPSMVTRGQFALSVIGVILLGASGYIGGLMVYDHGVGYRPEERDREEHDLKKLRKAA